MYMKCAIYNTQKDEFIFINNLNAPVWYKWDDEKMDSKVLFIAWVWDNYGNLSDFMAMLKTDTPTTRKIHDLCMDIMPSIVLVPLDTFCNPIFSEAYR